MTFFQNVEQSLAQWKEGLFSNYESGKNGIASLIVYVSDCRDECEEYEATTTVETDLEDTQDQKK